MTLWTWSQTANSDATADSTINWQEGQAPSTLNNSARAMMAAIAKYRDDISGSIQAGGTGNAITVATSQIITSLQDKFRVAFTITAQNNGAVTLQVDSQTAKPLRPFHNTDFGGGELVVGAVVACVYNAGNAEYIVEGYNGGNLTANANASLTALQTQGASGTNGVVRKTAANTFTLDEMDTALIFEKDNNGNTLATGIMGDLQCPFACTILSVTMLADQSGSTVIDIWKAAYASYPPTVSNTITASDVPTISSAVKMTDSTLTGWNTAISAGDCLRFNCNSATSITRLTIILKVKRFS